MMDLEEVWKFFFLRPLRRSVQLRREKKADVSAQSRGQMGRWRCAGCGNRICLEAAIRTSRARSHPRNFVSAPVAGPTATRRRCARFCRMGAPRARGAARAGRYLVPWDTGTECACLRARRWQSEAVPARCHSGVHSVWGRKKGRCKCADVLHDMIDLAANSVSAFTHVHEISLQSLGDHAAAALAQISTHAASVAAMGRGELWSYARPQL
jgi:hypothetical protein